MKDNDRLIMVKHASSEKWSFATNPPIKLELTAYSWLLINSANSYVEFENSGMQWRMIRASDVREYTNEDIPKHCILPVSMILQMELEQ